MKSNKQYWRIVVPACAGLGLSSLTSGMSQGPWAFAAGFGIGMCIVATLAGVVTYVSRHRDA